MSGVLRYSGIIVNITTDLDDARTMSGDPAFSSFGDQQLAKNGCEWAPAQYPRCSFATVQLVDGLPTSDRPIFLVASV